MTKKAQLAQMTPSYNHSIDNTYWEQTMYRMSPAPKKLPYDTRIRLCLERKNFYHFRCFLHDYEPSINGMTFSCCMRYDLLHYFGDVKQTIVTALVDALRWYKPETGVPFLAFAKYGVRDAVRDFIRLNSGMFSIPSMAHYRRLAKTNALYYAMLDEGKDSRACFAAIAEQMQITAQTAEGLIAEGEAFRPHRNKRPVFQRSLDDERSYPTQSFERGDRSADPGIVVPNSLFWDELISKIETLSFKEQYVLLRSCGVKCMYCCETEKSKSYTELANQFEHYSPTTMENLNIATKEKLQYLFPWWVQFERWGE